MTESTFSPLMHDAFRRTQVSLWAMLICFAAAFTARGEDATSDEFFEKQIRPILATRCLECHGEKKQEMSLRLDSAAGVKKGGDSGALVDPAHPDTSLLLQVLSHQGDIKMPPDGKLSDDEITSIKQWVVAGAPWPKGDAPVAGVSIKDKAKDHWAFQPVKRPSTPEVVAKDLAENSVDLFILDRLEKKKLSLSVRADRHTLLRRASYDLIGLSPSPEEFEAFEHDPSPDAFERTIDRLLASPHYGERWARHWLDVARYADTKGYVFVSERRYPFAYTYRDYVINSFNRDVPYNKFILEQLAADKLPLEGNKRELAAMGFLTVGRRFLNNGHDIIDDRIDVVSRGFLGLTVTCARCHDHKYDPISMADYYSLYGVFASSNEPDQRPIIGESESAELFASYQSDLAKRNGEIDAFIAKKRDEKEARLRKELPRLVMTWHETNGNQDDPRVKEIAQELGLNHGFVRTFMQRWQGFLTARLAPEHPIFGIWALYAKDPSADFNKMSGEINQQLTDSTGMAKTILPVIAEKFRSTTPQNMKEVVDRYCQLLIGDAPETAEVRKVLDEPGSPVKVSIDETVGTFDQGERNRLTDLRNRVEDVRVTHAGAPPEAMVMLDNPTPQEPHIFVRGNPNRPGDAVPRRFITFLDGQENPPFKEGSGRKELAEKIADASNPLTSRVFVNRLWHWHFGKGLAASTSDFGIRADKPSHPELLDYLAAEFIEDGWSTKSMHRAMMESATYQQSSADRSEGRELDPENDSLWSFRRRRVEFEELRDALLDSSGELDLRVCGRSVPIVGDNSSRRRAVYAYIDRQNLEGLFRTFDFANPNTSIPVRFVTTVPQQALYLMNSPFAIERSKNLADDPAIQSIESIEHRINAVYERVYRRQARPDEIAAGKSFLEAEAMRAVPESLPVWQYGVGEVDSNSGRVVGFKAFERFIGNRWTPTASYPDPEFSHIALSAEGGHPGKDRRQAAIRRWTAPHAMSLAISGKLNHSQKLGDGIEGIIVSSRAGIIGRWTAHKSEVETKVESVVVERGDTIDFVADPRGSQDFDSFRWSVTLNDLSPPESTKPSVWKSQTDFAGPAAPSLNPWQKYVQVLLLANEFAFID
jgi:hypothetical protein